MIWYIPRTTRCLGRNKQMHVTVPGTAPRGGQETMRDNENLTPEKYADADITCRKTLIATSSIKLN